MDASLNKRISVSQKQSWQQPSADIHAKERDVQSVPYELTTQV